MLTGQSMLLANKDGDLHRALSEHGACTDVSIHVSIVPREAIVHLVAVKQRVPLIVCTLYRGGHAYD